MIIICPHCGEIENFHFNHDYMKAERSIIDILCNECGSVFDPPQTIDDVIELKKEVAMKQNDFKKFTLMDETPSAPASDSTTMIDDVREDDVEKLAKEWCKSIGEDGFVRTGDDYDVHELPAFIAGYNKAKETLYTEEQVRKAIEDARDILSYVNTDEVIKSLKQ